MLYLALDSNYKIGVGVKLTLTLSRRKSEK